MYSKSLVIAAAISKLPRPANIHFMSAFNQSKMILHALRCGHNVTISRPKTTNGIEIIAKYFNQIDQL